MRKIYIEMTGGFKFGGFFASRGEDSMGYPMLSDPTSPCPGDTVIWAGRDSYDRELFTLPVVGEELWLCPSRLGQCGHEVLEALRASGFDVEEKCLGTSEDYLLGTGVRWPVIRAIVTVQAK